MGGVFGYSKISSQDIDRGYTRESTVSDVKRAEMLKLDSSFKPKVNYMNAQTEVFNEDKQIYEYRSTGEKTDKVYSLYYKNAKIKGVRVTILKGVRIGDGAVIAAGTIVNKDVPARALAAGNPMHLICDNVEWTN